MRKHIVPLISITVAVLVLSVALAGAGDDGYDYKTDPGWLRHYIGEQVGGINQLKVPATDSEIPPPKQPDGTVNPRSRTTEAKRYLGKLLFHDPVRTVRININQGQPVNDRGQLEFSRIDSPNLLPVKGRCLMRMLPVPKGWNGINEEAAQHGSEARTDRSGRRSVPRSRAKREEADS